MPRSINQEEETTKQTETKTVQNEQQAKKKRKKRKEQTTTTTKYQQQTNERCPVQSMAPATRVNPRHHSPDVHPAAATQVGLAGRFQHTPYS